MQYDPTRGVYLDDAGHAVPATRIQEALTRVVQDTQAHLAVLGQRRAEGMNTAEWRLAVQDSLRRAHVSAAGLAHGGLDQLDPSTRGFVGSRLREQYSFLSGVALDTSPGDFGGQAMARLAQYGNGAVRGTFSAVTRRDAGDRGDDEERNVLGGGNNCDECPALSDDDWVPLGTLPEIGTRQCLGNCQCEIITRSSSAATSDLVESSL